MDVLELMMKFPKDSLSRLQDYFQSITFMHNIRNKHRNYIHYKGCFFHRNSYNCILNILILLVVYSCSGLLNDKKSCGECQYWIKRGYDCQWCDSYPKCYHFTSDTCTQFHSKPNCKPVVKQVLYVFHF